MNSGPQDAVRASLAAAGARLDEREAWRGGRLPADDRDHAGLVVFGGVMNAHDDAGYPHLAETVALIARFHAAGKPVLGLCLGGQLIARAAGARIHRRRGGETGFCPLALTAAAAEDPLLAGLSSPQWLMQWHEDSFDTPAGAVGLMTAEACPDQAFRLGRATWGFQCHFEVTPEVVRFWLDETPEAATPALRARFAADLAAHAETALLFCRTVSARWAALLGTDQAR